jgi:thiamine pyrophosphate-dependent acetolactate synthase large subunit-like protein
MTDATRAIPVYEALALDLRAMGVECLFGLMSDDTALLAAAVDAAGVRFIGTRHENTAAAAAEGYAAASGRLGVALFGRGPATANAMHGVTYARRSGSRVLFLIGDRPVGAAPANGFGPDTKRFDSVAVLRSAGVPTMVALDPQGARRLLAQAADTAGSGAVALLLPSDVQLAMIDREATCPSPVAARPTVPRPARTAALQSAAQLLAHSRRPLLIAGAGAHLAGARDALVRLADRIGAALATTMKAKDLFRGHPFDCGVVGSFSHGGGRRLIEQADCILAVGAGLNQRTTAQGTAFSADVPLIQVDAVRTNIGRWYPADVAVVGDARLVAEQLADIVPERPIAEQPLRSPQLQAWLAQYDLSSDFVPADTERTLDARSVAIELDRLLPADRNVVYDAGNFLVAAPYLSVAGPSHIKQASDFSSIGMGFGTALGFAHATPGRTTVLMLGDGSFLMTLGELETVVRESIPLVVVLMNDCAYGAELHYLRLRGAPVALSQFPDVDYAPIAQAFGFHATTVRTREALRALASDLAAPDGPMLLDCKLNASVVAPFLTDGYPPTRR